MSKDDPFEIVRTREEVDMPWVRDAVSATVTMSFFHNKEVHWTVLMISECEENYN